MSSMPDDMNKVNFNSDIERHIAGATVGHGGPFSEVEVPQGINVLTRETIDKWVLPFYLLSFKESAKDLHAHLTPLLAELNSGILDELFRELNWRPRSVAARLVSVLKRNDYLDQVGRLLLRSDVCYAGADYCHTLAALNASESVEFLTEYLDYYLGKPALFFDQDTAMAALLYLDERNGTDLSASFLSRWAALCVHQHRKVDSKALIKRFTEEQSGIQDVSIRLSAKLVST